MTGSNSILSFRMILQVLSTTAAGRFLLILALIPLCGTTARAQVDWLQDIRNGQPKTIVTMGTSLTQFQPNWVAQVTAWLKDEATNPSNVSVFNVSVSGSASDTGLSTQMPNANALHPDVVFVEFAINDAFTPYNISQQTSVNNLNAIISGLKTQNPNVKVVPLTMNNPIGSALADRPNISNYYQGYRNVAQTQGLSIVDNYPKWLNLYSTAQATWNHYVPDGLHPNELGAINVTTPGIRRTLAGEVPFALGGFESVSLPGNSGTFAHESVLGLWTATNSAAGGNAVVVRSATALHATSPNISASEGDKMTTLQADNHLGSIQQTFDTLAGQQYRVNFDHSILSGGSGDRSAQALAIGVSATGNVAVNYTLISDPTVTASAATWDTLPYIPQSYVFTATGDSTTLSFANQTLYGGDPDFGTTIDNIVVTPVPEPAACALLLTPLILLARRQRGCHAHSGGWRSAR